MWLSERGRTKFDRWILLGVAFLLVFVPSAVRYGIGTDYYSYVDIYAYPEAHERIEPGFSLLNLFLRNIGAPSEVAIAVYALIFTAVAFLALPKEKRWLFHLLFFAGVMLFSYSGIRQAIAVAFTLCAVKEWVWGKQSRAILLMIVAATFHYSALIFLSVAFLSTIPVRDKIKGYVFPHAVLILLITILMHSSAIRLIESALLYVGSDYARYFGGRFDREATLGSGLGLLLYIVFSMFFIYCSSSLININKRYWAVVLLAGAYVITRALAAEVHIFYRLVNVFDAVPVYIAYILYIHGPIRSFNLKRIASILFSLIIVFAFIKQAHTSLNIGSGLGVNPYSSLLTR